MLLFHVLLTLAPFYDCFLRVYCTTLQSSRSSLPLSQTLATLVKEALAIPQVLTRLPPETALLLHALIDNPPRSSVKTLSRFICESYSYESLQSVKRDPAFWRVLADDTFYRLAQIDHIQAQELVDKVIIPNHPFSNELHGLFKASKFFKSPFLRLNALFDHDIAPIFNARLAEILANPNASTVQAEFEDLLDKYRRTISWRYGPQKHACTFLISIGLEHVRPSAVLVGVAYDFYSDINHFAATVYNEILARNSPKGAKHAQNILRAICSLLQAKDYYDSMHECLKNAGEPTHVQKLQEYMREALSTPQVYNSISHHTRAILTACQQDTHTTVPKVCIGFLEHLCAHSTHTHILSHKDIYGYWDSLIQSSFVLFIESSPEDARAILNQIILPGSPPLISGYSRLALHTAQLFHNKNPSDYMSFTEEICQLCFAEGLSEILANTNLKEAQLQFAVLMHKYKEAMSYQYPSYKYHFTFLLIAGLEGFRLVHSKRSDGCTFFFQYPDLFAAQVYDVIADEYPRRAQGLLTRVVPYTYSKAGEKPYLKVIEVYMGRGAGPIDVKRLKKSLTEALNTLAMMAPPHQSLLRALQQDSILHEIFLCYIFYNYEVSRLESQESAACFWRSLIYSSVSKFAQEHPNQAQELLSQVITTSDADTTSNAPSLDEKCKAFTVDLFVDFRSQESNPLTWAIWNGHTATVKYLVEGDGELYPSLQSGQPLLQAATADNTEIFNYLFSKNVVHNLEAVSKAFMTAALLGNAGILSNISNGRIMINTFSKRTALMDAIIHSNTAALRVLIQENSSITHTNDFALEVANRKARNSTFSLLLHHGGTFSTYCKDQQFVLACQKSQVALLDQLFAAGVFPSNYARGKALMHAAMAGKIEIVIYMMRSDTFPSGRTDQQSESAANRRSIFFENHKDKILSLAAQNGHVTVVKHLLSHLAFTQCAKDDAFLAAVYDEKTTSVDFLMSVGVSASAQNRALVLAADLGHTKTVMLIANSGTVLCERAKNAALQCAAEKFHAEAIFYITSGKAVFAECQLDEELLQASIEGDAKTVKRLLLEDNGTELSTYAKDQALIHAVEFNHKEIVEFLMGKHVVLTAYAKELALTRAVGGEDAQTLQLLLKSGTGFDNEARRRMFHFAASSGQIAAVDKLLKLGVDVKREASLGLGLDIKTGAPLELALGVKGEQASLELDVDSTDDMKNYALVIACDGGHTETAALLINTGFDFAECAKNEALIAASKKNHNETLQYLLRSRLKFTSYAKTQVVIYLGVHENMAALELFVEHGQVESVCLIDAIAFVGNTNRERFFNFVRHVLDSRGEVL